MHIDDWIETKCVRIALLYENAGTPLRGGGPIAVALIEAFRRGQRTPNEPEVYSIHDHEEEL